MRGVNSQRVLKRWADEELRRMEPDIVAALIVAPRVVQMLGDAAGKRVVELGRSDDRWHRLFRQLGATSVDGDVSKQTKVPRMQVGSSGIHFITKRNVDVVFMDHVLSGLPSVEELDGAIGCARDLIGDTDGRLIISDRNPITSWLPGVSWAERPKYFEEGARRNRVMMEGVEGESYQIHPAGYHWPLETVHGLLVRHGLRVSDLEEPVLDPARAGDFPEPPMSEYFMNFPTTVLIEAKPEERV